MLSILCVTKAEPYSMRFLQAFSDLARLCQGELVIAADGREACETLLDAPFRANVVPVESQGYIESVLDEALHFCHGDYVLRLDDDELPGPSMAEWLAERGYLAAQHWKFSRAHLWGDCATVVMNAPLWPDHQTRLSVKPLAGGRRTIHSGSPFGGGELAPVLIEHHKFLIKPVGMRRAIAETYDRTMPGAGTGGFLAFNIPEDAYSSDQLDLRPLASAVEAAAHDAGRSARLKTGHMTLAIEMSDEMFVAVSKATDILKLPQNQDFALHAMGLVLRSMGLAPRTGRPLGYRHSGRAANRKPPVVKRRRRRCVNR